MSIELMIAIFACVLGFVVCLMEYAEIQDLEKNLGRAKGSFVRACEELAQAKKESFYLKQENEDLEKEIEEDLKERGFLVSKIEVLKEENMKLRLEAGDLKGKSLEIVDPEAENLGIGNLKGECDD